MKKILIGLSAIALMPWTAAAQENESHWSAPLTEHGQPDLQGIWYFGSATPFERPDDLGEQLVYSADEAQELETQLQQRDSLRYQALDADRPAPNSGAAIGIEAEFDYMVSNTELVPVNGEYRTSLIVSPANGKMPVNPDFQDYYTILRGEEHGIYDSVATIGAGERCLIYGLAVPSSFPMPWNAHLQIVQNKDYVVLHSEMIHDARIVRLNQDHRADDFDRWMGDSVGYWEEQTLVVKTANFRPEQSAAGMLPKSEEFFLTEWFTPVSDKELIYRFRIDDAKAFTEPMVVERVIQRVAPDARIYEFACHEGNYSLAYSLIGGRYDDLRAEQRLDEVVNAHLDQHVIEALVGHWTGTVNDTQLSFRFLKGNNGGLHMLLDIPSVAMRDLPLAEVASDGKTLEFLVPVIAARYSATINNDLIEGTWTREDNPRALTLERSQ